jgi:hypothetical protein
MELCRSPLWIALSLKLFKRSIYWYVVCMYYIYRYAVLAAHCSPVPVKVPRAVFVVSNISWFFISSECSSAKTLLGPKRLSGFNGGLSVMTPESEVHFESLCRWSLSNAFPCRWASPTPGYLCLSFTESLLCPPLIWRWLGGCDGGLSTMTRTLEFHLEWRLSTAVSASCTFPWLRGWGMLVIYGEVGGDLRTCR